MKRTVFAFLCVLCASAVYGSSAAPKIFYSKSFPKSTPAYVAITIDQAGNGEYKEAEDDDSPLQFQLTAKEASEIFSLADKLGHFDHPLESGLKVAQTGIKTFRWEDGATKHEVKFNFSTDQDARLLLDWFERIAESEQRYIGLERAAKYDRLGVNQELLLLEISKDHKRLVAAQQFLPLLDRIAKNESYLHMARERAANLADAFRKEQ